MHKNSTNILGLLLLQLKLIENNSNKLINMFPCLNQQNFFKRIS